MATKFNGNSVKLYLKERADDDSLYKEVLCATQTEYGIENAEIEADSKCGPDSLPGQQSFTVSYTGYALNDAAGTGTVSYKELKAWAKNKTELSFHITDDYTAPSIEGEEGDCTIGTLNAQWNTDEAAGFDFTLLVSGTPVTTN